MNKYTSINRVLLTAISVFLLSSTTALTCNVPVFRYALERWPADIYEVFVFHYGTFSTVDRLSVERLEKSSADHIPYANYTIQAVDISKEIPGSAFELWQSLKSPKIPCLVLRYPVSTGTRHAIWHGKLNSETVKTLPDSPTRSEIGERILGGDSAVWILLESGNRKKDDAAADVLRENLKDMEETLTLPPQFSETVKMPIRFSLIRLSRTDPAEAHFISMLMNSEPDLFDYASHPMAFPIYGRGRVLFALVGEGINERNIGIACSFIIGPCSCEIKAQNPGIDLLMNVDWEAGIDKSWAAVLETQTLFGISGLADAARDGNTSDSALMFPPENGGDSSHADRFNNTDKAKSPGSISGSNRTASVEIPLSQENNADTPHETEIDGKSQKFIGNMLITLGVILMFITVIRLWLKFRITGEK